MSGDPTEAPCVLIVEDEEPIAQALAFIIEDAGYRPVMAIHGKAALAVLQTCEVRLIITDLMMPQMDGAQLIAALHAAAVPGQVLPPMVLMSAAGSRYLAATGADAVLPKPFDIADVEALLERFLH